MTRGGVTSAATRYANPMPTINDLLIITRRRLEDADGLEAALEAEVLVMHVLGVTRAQLYTHRGDPAEPPAVAALDAAVARRVTGEPLAYVIGHREFYALDFQVDKRVLIPRPETELLVDEALVWLRGHFGQRLSIADVGTGSGAIAVSIARNYPGGAVYAIDASSGALEVAKANAERLGVAGRVMLLEGDLLRPLQLPIDLIIANLPYVREDQMPLWCGATQVELAFEPFDALCGGPDGLDVIRRLMQQAPAALREGGAVMLEIGADQGEAVSQLAQQAFPEGRVRLKKDLAGLDRMVIAEARPPSRRFVPPH